MPYTRGAEYSRPASAVLSEARQLVAAGAIEITLLGQNVNAYHGEAPDGSTWSLARLIHALAEIDGVARIRYTTSHPRDMDDDLIAAHGAVPQLMPYLHLPVQSGSDRILEAMNRRHGRDLFLGLVDRLAHARADLALSSDFIVGFREKATPTSTTPCGWSTRWASPRPSPSSTAAVPARRARRCPTRCPRR